MLVLIACAVLLHCIVKIRNNIYIISQSQTLDMALLLLHC